MRNISICFGLAANQGYYLPAIWETGKWLPLQPACTVFSLTVVYRPFNNPFIDALVRGWQRGSGVELIMKGREGARRLTQVLKGDGHTIMLVDVRMNEGIDIPFLGIDAMTPTAPAALALKYDALLVPVRVERMDLARFRLTVEEPRPPVDTGNRNSDIEATMRWINGRFSEWITERPEQWMWFHRRWGKIRSRPSDLLIRLRSCQQNGIQTFLKPVDPPVQMRPC